MESFLVLLVCGGGASSGFLASSIRKAAKKRNLNIEVVARSESEIEDYLESASILLYGPHLKYMENEIIEKVKDTSIVASIIPQQIYGLLDGEKSLDLILQLKREKDNNE